MPVLYAAAMCLAFLISLGCFPFATGKRVRMALSFFLGTGVPISFYCIGFMCGESGWIVSLILLFMFILSLYLAVRYYKRPQMSEKILLVGSILLIAPFVLGMLVLRQSVIQSILFGIILQVAIMPLYLLARIGLEFVKAEVRERWSVAMGMIVPFVALAIYLLAFNSYLRSAQNTAAHSATPDEFVAKLPSNYFTERILGLHWKYHTCVDYYKGWRPPMHDPFLVIALWCNPYLDYPDVKSRPIWMFNEYSGAVYNMRGNRETLWPHYNEEAVFYYHKKFPEKPLQMWCPCSFGQGSRDYFRAQLNTWPARSGLGK